MNVKIAASILSADFSRLGKQAVEAIEAGASYIHVDVMDGHFVPNLTVGPQVVASLKPITQSLGAVLDVHLMVERPENLIPDFARAGADNITVHVETCPNLHRTIQQIKGLGVMAGVTLNPATSLTTLDEILPDVNLALVMSVNPGFGGQTYIQGISSKIKRLRHTLDTLGLKHVELEVDGGIKPENAGEVVAAGASILVIGSAIFNSHASIKENVTAVQKAIGMK